jgi:multiple sugar transport system permease protein
MAQTAASSPARRTSLNVTLRRYLGRDWSIGIPFILPTVLLCIGLIGYPVIYALYLSLTTKIAGRPEQFIGFANYISLWNDSNYRAAVWVTVYYTIISVFFKFCIGMGLALLLNTHLPARNVLTGLILLPWIAPPVVTALTWRWILEPSFGAFNYLIVNVLHVATKGVDWFGISQNAMAALLMTVIWRGFPFFAVMLLAGLKAINQEMYEAAAVDGAGVVQRFMYITLPGLRNVALVVVLLATIWTFNDFTIAWNLNQGGPAGATTLYSILTYQVAFRSLQLGKGVAISATMLPILIVLVIVLVRYMRRR